MSAFVMYLLGMLVLVGGVAYVPWLMHTPMQWLVAGIIGLLGLGMLATAKRSRRAAPQTWEPGSAAGSRSDAA